MATHPEPPWLENESSFTGRELAYAGTTYRSTDETTCPLCPLLRQVRVQRQFYHQCDDSPDDKVYFSPLSGRYGQIFGSGDGATGSDLQGLAIVSVGPASSFLNWEYPGDLRMRHNTGAPEQTILLAVAPENVRREFDPSLIHEWLRYCNANHSACRDELPITSRFPMTLIDCNTRKLVPRDDNAAYVTLSYVWGRTISQQPSYSAGCLPDDIPMVVQDAMQVVKALGFDYLWVDRYCINQNDVVHVEEQIGQMDDIYRGAELTIVAAAGDDGDFGLSGVNPSTFLPPKRVQLHIDGTVLFPINAGVPLHEISRKKWSTRGWTYQEAYLSHRCLIFTEEWIYFECKAMACWERQEFKIMTNLDGLDAQLAHCTQYSRRLFDFPSMASAADQGFDIQSNSSQAPISTLCSMISRYTERQLTFDSDSLRAFSGVLNRYGAVYEFRLRHLWGIPFLVNKETSIEIQSNSPPQVPGPQSLFMELLCWLQSKEGSGRRRAGFPSWSWAGWNGAASFYRVRWPDKPAHGDWKRASLQGLAHYGDCWASMMTIDGILIPPSDAIQARENWGLCMWNKFEAHVTLDAIKLADSSGREFVELWKSGRLEILILYGIRGDMIQGLVIEKLPDTNDVYQRAGLFSASHSQKEAYNDEIMEQWRNDFERCVEKSGWEVRRIHLV